MPGSRLGKTKLPAELVCTSRAALVCVLVTTTVAPTRMPPLASVTAPEICPKVWAKDGGGTATNRLRMSAQPSGRNMESLLFCLRLRLRETGNPKTPRQRLERRPEGLSDWSVLQKTRPGEGGCQLLRRVRACPRTDTVPMA